ncbi:MAG: hypothetical protein MRERC_2c041 [Mycoplasmataceae bacterium RC_NB112A]|nr:MAG: hypothetical protein MRERC_2c041 [Mycoplasmataceae bacterium RC_NB112A]
MPLLAVSPINNPNIEQARKTKASRQVLMVESSSVPTYFREYNHR